MKNVQTNTTKLKFGTVTLVKLKPNNNDNDMNKNKQTNEHKTLQLHHIILVYRIKISFDVLELAGWLPASCWLDRVSAKMGQKPINCFSAMLFISTLLR